METKDLVQCLAQNSTVNFVQLLSDLLLQTEQLTCDSFSNVSKLSALLQTINYIIEVSTCAKDTSVKIEWADDVVLKNIKKVCFGILHVLQPSVDSRHENFVLLGHTCSLVKSCVINNSHNDMLKELLDMTLTSFHYHVTERTHMVDSQSASHIVRVLDIFCSLEVVKTVLLPLCTSESEEIFKAKCPTSGAKNLNEIFQYLLQIIYNFENKTVVHFAIQGILQFLKINDGKDVERLVACWDNIQQLYREDISNTKSSMLLCSLANNFLPVDGSCTVTDLRTSEAFWNIIQTGLCGKDTLLRKQCMYLLKRTVDSCHSSGNSVVCIASVPKSQPLFSWDSKLALELNKVWEDFIMLIETLEEKQVHVIKPLLPRMQNLIKATELQQGPMLHTSWLTVLVRRALVHESIFVVRWAVDTMLAVDMSTCPVMLQNQDQYFCTDFLVSIQDAKLYSRSPDAAPGACPACAEGLTHFFQNCWHALETTDKKAEFFGKVLETLSCNSWGPAPFLYLCQALSRVPVSPLLDVTAVLNLRKTMTANQATVYSYLRGAIQSFCANTLINLTDVEVERTKHHAEVCSTSHLLCPELKSIVGRVACPLQQSQVSPMDICSILSVFSHEESLQRGTTLWKKFVHWFQSASKKNLPEWSCDNIRTLLSKQVANFLLVAEGSSFSFNKSTTVQIARLCLMAADAALLPLTTDSNKVSMNRVIAQATDIINTITTHPYMSSQKAEKAIELMLSFLQELGKKNVTDEVSACVIQGLDCCVAQMLVFIRQQLSDGWKQLQNVHSIELCEKAVSMITERYHGSDVTTRVINLVKTSIVILQKHTTQTSLESQMQLVGASSILGSIARVHTNMSTDTGLVSRQSEIVQHIIDYVTNMELTLSLSKPSSVDSQKEWGKITSAFLSNQWCLLLLYLLNKQQLPVAAGTMLDLCLESFSLMGGRSVLSTFRCIQHLLPFVVSEGETDKLLCVLDQGWSCVMEQMTGTRFFSVFAAFVSMVYQPALLRQPENSSVIEKLLQYCDIILTLGEEKNGVSTTLVSQLCRVWSAEDMLPHIYKFYPVIVNACLYGPIHKKQEKQQYEMDAYLETLGNQCSVNEVMTSVPKDCMVRLSVVNLLCKLRADSSAHVQLVQGLLDQIIIKYWEISKISKGSTFPNSLVHRQKQRLMQIMVLMEPFMSGKYFDKMWTFCLDGIAQEKQPSVRHMIEWLALRLLCHHGNLVNKMWDVFMNVCETKTMVVCSLLCIISHLGPNLEGQSQVEYYSRAVPAVLPWCMAHHFNSRLHAQAALTKLWSQCQQFTDVLSKYALVQSVLSFNEKTNNSTKNVGKLLENYFMKTFDCVQDYSIQTIFHTLPRLSGLIDDEWIPPETFSQMDAMWVQDPGRTWIPLHNKTESLQKCTPGSWRLKTLVSGMEEDDGKEGDVQKKIMPWRLMTPDEETQEELDYYKKRHQPGGLILVTSLIDKLPNLGGLCRTSEIFGVSEFVIGKMKYLEDKMFQSLSVTAHKWLPITEVYHTKLGQYLTEKKQDGYTLVGVEQTANSVNLTDFEFPQKSLLLLGNEKEGIPVEIINLLDVCVEIPQQGIIRSLNVHVSGALLVWEYRRQQLVADKTVTYKET